MLSFDVSTTDNAIAAPGPATSSSWDGLLLAASGVLAFSLSLPMTRLAGRNGLDAWFVASARAAVAGALALGILRLRHVARPGRADLGRLAAVAGGVVVGFPLLSGLALQHVPAVHGSVVNGLLPLATAGGAVLRAGERPGSRYWLCSIVGLFGVLLYALHRGGGSLHLGDLLMLGAVGAAAVGYTEGGMLARRLGGWQVICWALVLALPLTLPAAALTAHRNTDPTLVGWGTLGYVSLFSMLLGFFGWYAGLARAGIARCGQIQLVQPILAIAWSWPLLGERPDRWAAATAAIVVGAVVVGRSAVITRPAAPPAVVGRVRRAPAASG